MNYLKPFDPAYCVEEERNCRRYTKYYEGVFAQGSGYLQIRGSYEEGLACADQGELYMRMPANVTIEKPRHPYSKWGSLCAGRYGDPSHAEGRAGEPALSIKAGRYRRWGKSSIWNCLESTITAGAWIFGTEFFTGTLTGVRKAGLSAVNTAGFCPDS